MRTFQFSDAKSHKFWTIAVTGESFTVTYGKVGAAGQTSTKTFATAEKARAEADKLVAEKTAKGYVETTPAAAVSDEEALERNLVANPHDVAAWSAFADFLTEKGDPRGEFMRVQLALEDETLPKSERDAFRKQEKALLKKHEREWLGPLAGVLIDARPTEAKYAFRRGWLADLEFASIGVESARLVVRCREARLLRKLGIDRADYEVPEGTEAPSYIDGRYAPGPDVPEGTESPGFHVLLKFPHFAGIRHFRMGNPPTPDFEESDQNHTDGELAHHFLKQMPNVEEVYLLAHGVDVGKVFALPLPNLRVLMYYHGRAYPLEKLANNKSLGNLTALYCHPHAIDYDDAENGAYIRLTHLKAICRSKYLTNLTHLRLRLTDFGDKGAEEIVASGILKRLKVLDLMGGCITDAGAEVLAKCPDLANLESLNLSLNAMTKKGISALTEHVKLEAKDQHQQEAGEFGEGDGDDIPEYLFEGDIE